MKIIQERSKCIGCGSCAAVCPDFFEIGENGLASLKGAVRQSADSENFELEVKSEACFREAAEVCPVQIIKIET